MDGFGPIPRRSPRLAELEMGRLRRRNGAHQLHPAKIPRPVEQTLAAPEEDRGEADLHLVHEPRREILLRGARAPREHHVLCVGGSPRAVERGLDPVGDEREGRSTFELERATSELLDDGIRKFVQPFEKLLATVEARTRELAGRGA